MKKFTQMQNFSIISSLRHFDLNEALEDIAYSKQQGADGFLLHIQLLDQKYQNSQTIKKVLTAADKPVMVLNYRSANCRDDDKLNILKLEAAKLGAAAVDIPADTFDYDCVASLKDCKAAFAAAKPAEISMRKDVVEKQKQLIADIRALGCEVLMSAHIGTMLSAEQGVELAKEIESRGADIVKIILRAESQDDAVEIYRTLGILKKSLKVPFLYQTSGKYGKFVRPTAWMFGSCMVLCHSRYSKFSNTEKPLISDVKKVKDTLYWE